MEKFTILAFYCFTKIEDPAAEVARQRAFLEQLDAQCRLYVAHNGLNAQMSFGSDDAQIYMDWLKEDPRFANTHFKFEPYDDHVFAKSIIKTRKQLVALDQDLDPARGGEHASPEEWKKMLEEGDENTILIDVRNDYESDIGHFEGAELPPLKTFREFPIYARELKKRVDPSKTRVMMYCTGGIRCELYSALMKDEGFDNVVQLDGGVINYGQKVGNSHWKGKLFVFDDRLSAPISDDEHELISTCHNCSEKTDIYYNCANMDCNELFLACKTCAKELEGCCSEECIHAERRRAFDDSERPKPFRKWYACTLAEGK